MWLGTTLPVHTRWVSSLFNSKRRSSRVRKGLQILLIFAQDIPNLPNAIQESNRPLPGITFNIALSNINKTTHLYQYGCTHKGQTTPSYEGELSAMIKTRQQKGGQYAPYLINPLLSIRPSSPIPDCIRCLSFWISSSDSMMLGFTIQLGDAGQIQQVCLYGSLFFLNGGHIAVELTVHLGR